MILGIIAVVVLVGTLIYAAFNNSYDMPNNKKKGNNHNVEMTFTLETKENRDFTVDKDGHFEFVE